MTTPTEMYNKYHKHNREEIPKSNCIKYLGGWVNAMLSFKTHITKKCQAAMVNLVKIHNIRKYLTEYAAKTLLYRG